MKTKEVTDVLAHVGVRGMKWGIRKKRSESSSEDYKKSRELKRKKISEMSDAELRAVNNRLQLEQTYKSLNPDRKAAGRKRVYDILGKLGSQTMNLVINSVANAAAQKFVNDVLKIPSKG